MVDLTDASGPAAHTDVNAAINILSAGYGSAQEWMAQLSGLSHRLAELMRDLNELPRHEVAHVIALAHASVGGLTPEELFQRHLEQLPQR